MLTELKEEFASYYVIFTGIVKVIAYLIIYLNISEVWVHNQPNFMEFVMQVMIKFTDAISQAFKNYF